MNSLRALLVAGVIVACYGAALAKLPPAPPMTDQQKQAAEEKKAKDTASSNNDKILQARTEDRVAAKYIADQKAKGITVIPQMGPTAATLAASLSQSPKPPSTKATPEKAAAHSPPTK